MHPDDATQPKGQDGPFSKDGEKYTFHGGRYFDGSLEDVHNTLPRPIMQQ
jgi:hypothetical protein